MKSAPSFAPVVFTLLLLIWTALVYSGSQYGSWHIYPALAVVPLVLLCHVALIVWHSPRMPFVLYAVAHLIVLIPLWVWCLMLISKDSL